jgi:hypothetical protein
LARWLTAPDNPLTSRVLVNNVWDHLFGRGLIARLDDMGVRADQPSHPALLNWLASDLQAQGWSRKRLIKRIVMSATYRQRSVHRPELAETDPNNVLLHRQNRFRVDAEIVRDQHLAAAGLLSPKIGGPSVFPPLPADVAKQSYANNFRWKTSGGEDRYRRGMYTFFKRTAPDPNLIMFDCPDGNFSVNKRSDSNTPVMALATLQNEVFVETAQALAKRALSQKGGNAARVRLAFRLCVARPPTRDESQTLLALLDKSRRWYADHETDAKLLAGKHAAPEEALQEAAAWVATARIIMNLDEFITRE